MILDYILFYRLKSVTYLNQIQAGLLIWMTKNKLLFKFIKI